MTDSNDKSVDSNKAVETADFDSNNQSESQPVRLQSIKLAAVISAVGCLVLYVLRLDHIAGLFVDDGWYVLLAQSLASGQGYTLANSPTPGVLPFYPPAFPFLLSLLYRLYPEFPNNVWLLKSLSVAAILSMGVIAYRYFTRERSLSPLWALGIVVIAVISPPLVFLATSTVMSECVFTFFTVAAIAVTERAVRLNKESLPLMRYIVAGSLLTAIAFLTRSIAIGLLLAALLYLAKERMWRAAVVFTAVFLICVAPWTIYAQRHAPTIEQRQDQGGMMTKSYSEWFWSKRAGVESAGTVTIAQLPQRVLTNVLEISGRDVGRLITTPIFEALRDPLEEAKQNEVRETGRGSTIWFSFLLSIVALIGFISVVREKITLAEIAIAGQLGIIVLWPWETFRFVLPLTPFLIFYFVMGCRAIFEWAANFYPVLGKSFNSAMQLRLVGTLIVAIIAVNLYGHVSYLSKMYSDKLSQPAWLTMFDDIEAMFRWVKSGVPQDAIIATPNPPMVYLYTKRKTVDAEAPAYKWDRWKQMGVNYLVRAASVPEPIDPAEAKFKVLYRSRGNASIRVIDLGPPNERPDWNSTMTVPGTGK